MTGLARFIMRGRLQALLVVMISVCSVIFSAIGAAGVALVTLRRGEGNGAWLLLWALLPAIWVTLQFSDPTHVALLLGAYVLAVVLRRSVSLLLTMLAAVAVGLLTGFILLAFGGDLLQNLAELLGQLLSSWEAQLKAQGSVAEDVTVFSLPGKVEIAAMLGLANAATSALCLFLARYWQAALYNPGGFGEEYRELRIPLPVTVCLAVLVVVCLALGGAYSAWARILVLPWVFASLALVHARAAMRPGSGTGMLVAFYALWIVFDAVKLMLVLAAIADSHFDFRSRWRGPGASPPAAPGDDRDSE